MDNSGGIEGNMTAGLAGRYATALFDLAQESNAIDAVAASLADLRTALAESEDFAALVNSPVIARSDAARGVAAVAGAMQLDSLTTKFLGVLAENRRLAKLPGMITAYGTIVAEIGRAHV